MKPSLLNPMSGALRAALGQAYYMHALGQAEAPVYNVKTSRGGFEDQTYSFLRNIKSTGYVNWRKFDVTDTKAGRTVTFYYEPSDYVAAVGGDCKALAAFNNGLTIPYIQGITFIEPGVFHPEKSWDQMVTESNNLRTGNVQTFELCSSGSAYPNNDAGAFEYFFTGILPNGQKADEWPHPNYGGFCVQAWDASGNGTTCGGIKTLCAPKKYENTLTVAFTIAAWMDTLTKSPRVKDYVFCGTKPNTTLVVDPQFGHKYEVKSYTVSHINRKGVAGSRTTTAQGPLIEFQVKGDSRWFAPPRDKLLEKLASGRPIANSADDLFGNIFHAASLVALVPGEVLYQLTKGGSSGITNVRWWDDKTPIQPGGGAGPFTPEAQKENPTANAALCVTPCTPNSNGCFCKVASGAYIRCTCPAPGAITAGPTGPAADTTDWAKYIGYGGIAVGGIFILSALLRK